MRMAEQHERPKATPTIYDVAARAGVSITTVSRVINAPSQVRADTRARVYKVVRELGFTPKADAATRARKGTRRIGIAGPFSAIPSCMERLRGILAIAKGSQYEIVVYEQESVVLHHHFADNLSLSTKLDGLILIDMPITDQLAKQLSEDGLETVLIEYPRPGMTCVTVDDLAGGRLAARYLVERGHRRCAFLGIASPPERSPMFPARDLRLRGFREGLAEAGLELPDQYVGMARDLNANAMRQGAHALLELDPSPTAVFAFYDEVAAEVLMAARERGLRVPDDVAVIGFDDRDFAVYLGLTTVRQHLAESGERAFQLLRDRIAGTASDLSETVVLPLTVVSRYTA
jgi:DNA-binding LacI/PurR family transcriptional regulator